MHPNGAFRFVDDASMLSFAAARGFAHIFATTPEGPMVAHAPITPFKGAFRFHVARGNPIARHLNSATLLLSVSDSDGYVSPSWYADPLGSKHVPTWNYVAVEIVGTARLLDDAELTAQLDTLAAINEPRVSPELQWTRAKTDSAYFDKLLKAIVGVEVAVEAVRGTTKLSQHRLDEDNVGVIAGLRRSGNPALAEAMAR
ncbi:FMN-binding negative transcriptional regulator [Sphingomonas sp. HMP6]|uniref:FMN-binding negative transcriptional regulator n=1 Tax=Sphingomonas sp. HMP6 TaxID=1517551 RepID=UPI001596DD95|nr:FMN-binding negative transcriptional regulator [Sphingomonas sp. HMP6]BCA60517.1 negative transcriptional regulator [Sphingomonas sp. HMP6]